MKRLATLFDYAFAHSLLASLEDAGIAASMTSEHPALGQYGSTQFLIIWVDDTASFRRAQTIYEEMLQAKVSHQCCNCGYELQGHAGRTRCPECGIMVVAPERDRICRNCGETVPGEFDICWNCGQAISNRGGAHHQATDVRGATADDLPAILNISNHYAQETPANFAIEPEPLEQWTREFQQQSAMYPWLVATDSRGDTSPQDQPQHAARSPSPPAPHPEGEESTIIGFARASPWKRRSAYAFAAETTVYIHPDHHGRGVGTALYQRLLAILDAQGYRCLLGGITLPNAASVALHESMGFRKVAHFEKVGWKFGRWHDVGYWQRLAETDAPPEQLRPVSDVIEKISD